MNHKTKLFPNRFTIQIDGDERWALDALYDLDPHLVDETELVHKAIRAGIKVMNQDAARRRADPDRGPTRTEIAARKRSEASGPSVQNDASLALDERFRRKVELFLRDHPDVMPEEEASALLQTLGLD